MRPLRLLFASAVCGAALAPVAGARPAAPRPRPSLPAAPALKSAKLDSRLAGIAQRAGEGRVPAALKAAVEAGFTVRGKSVQVALDTRGEATTATAEQAVRAAGGTVQASSEAAVQALVPVGSLSALAAKPGVADVRPPARAHPSAIDEGVHATNADIWHAPPFDDDGTGVKIAVVDLGFSGYESLQSSGALPTDLQTQNFCSLPTDAAPGSDPFEQTIHGAAVTEVVHQMAPGAQLYLVCADTDVALAEALPYLEGQGIQVVNMSVAFFDVDRGDGTGADGSPAWVVAQAHDHGILWVNSAGNYATEHWSGTFVDSGDGYNRFAPGADSDEVWVDSGEKLCADLQWDDWSDTSQDYDLYLRDPSGTDVASSVNRQGGDDSLPPTESLCYTNSEDAGYFEVRIFGYDVTTSPQLDLYVTSETVTTDLTYPVAAGSVPVPASSPDVVAVGAECWQRGGGIEPYSSQGPTIDSRTKPDIAGPDSVSTVTYGQATGCESGFAGTSAASPQVAGAAAILLQRHPDLTVDKLKQALLAETVDFGQRGPDELYGAGDLFLYSPPAAETSGTWNVGQAVAVLSGTVDPSRRDASSWYFEYGRTSDYGQQTQTVDSDGTASAYAVTALVAQLQAGTLYHYCLVAQTVDGTSSCADADQTFQTPPEPPRAPPPAPPPSPGPRPGLPSNPWGGGERPPPP